jgi:lipid-binding SYLF domain-containing protein
MTVFSSSAGRLRHCLPRLAAAILVLGACTELKSEFEGDKGAVSRDLVARAEATVKRFKTDPKLAQFNQFLEGARGVVVLPTVLKAGFIGAAEAGNGVLLVRRADDTWSYPAFYTLGAASVGLQAGLQGTEVVLILRNAKAIDAMLRHQAKLGADAGITVGLLGGGMEASTTTNLGADVLAFAHSIAGVFGGVSLEGAVLVRRNDLNAAYYGAPATPRAIVIEGGFSNAGAEALRAALAAP